MKTELEQLELWEKEPEPIKSEEPASWDLVIADLTNANIKNPEQSRIQTLIIADAKKRDLVGENKYGMRLQPFNGRKSLKDAYEEILDAVVYYRTEYYELVNKSLIITPESELYARGVASLYYMALDIAMKTKYLMDKKINEKSE